ncbi:MAG: GxxExxY protein [Anaerolineae bacterium]|nr:GxxExxY protein [Anaerolineae bacterium]
MPYVFVREIPVIYEGEHIGTSPCRLLIVDEKVIVAAFAVSEMSDTFDVKMRRYLDYFGMRLGLLANFHGEQLEIRPVRLPPRVSTTDNRNARSTTDNGNTR